MVFKAIKLNNDEVYNKGEIISFFFFYFSFDSFFLLLKFDIQVEMKDK